MDASFRAKQTVDGLAPIQKACAGMGTSPQEVPSMIRAETARRRGVPFVPGGGWDGMVPRHQADDVLGSFFGPDDDNNWPDT